MIGLPAWAIQAIGAAVIMLAAAFGGYELKGQLDKGTIAEYKASTAIQQSANSQASLAKLQSFINQMTAASTDYSKLQGDMNAQFAVINKGLAAALQAKPLPVDCKPDAERMRVLTAAIAAANTHQPTAAGH